MLHVLLGQNQQGSILDGRLCSPFSCHYLDVPSGNLAVDMVNRNSGNLIFCQ